jgi:hypothetical protein
MLHGRVTRQRIHMRDVADAADDAQGKAFTGEAGDLAAQPAD